jgi:rubrerythrin
MANTNENLKGAFAGESQANRRYLTFSRKAEQEGLAQIAKLFRAAAEAETVHALNHLNTLGEVKTTEKNLETAISGETFEFKQMYPNYIETAKKEGNDDATWSFDVANKVEQVHARLYTKALEALRSKKELPKTDYYICKECGNTVEGAAPDKCPICGAPKSAFYKAP